MADVETATEGRGALGERGASGERGALDGVLKLGTQPVAAALMTATVALYMALVAFGNITDFDNNQQFVRHVLAMDTTFRDQDLMWRAITSRTLQDTAYVAIIVWEVLTALVLIAATVWWVPALRSRSRSRSRSDERARRASTLGLVMVLLLFGAGFIAIGGEWFAMWESKDWNGLDSALRNVVLGGLALVVVNLSSSRGALPRSRS
ncbi:DUF2165 domain-containing protein [Streptomyces sp. TS71-3]|uniref:DUF2165 domain-containing protein n=1 Tax=Streptomyces sp. TS71-3 TaxID=2733862 RepID=UPI001B11157A|nr:DUF2165 domain-containing protein [Streptomyces sp. TS71-3]GHJ35274.1 membrane protein [Streptomyces sp. TS71-3]